jgi:hypothetical protein
LLLYAWHPLPLFEFAGSGHIDAAAIAVMVFACWMAEVKRPLAAGALLGGAALIKFFPLAIAPALYRRWGWRMPAAMLSAVLLLYLPYLGVGRQVLGFLPGYVQEEGLAEGSGFFLLRALSGVISLPPWAGTAYLVVAAAILAGLAGAVVMRRDRLEVALAPALMLITVFTVVVSPHQAWYFTWVIPLLCFTPSWAVIYLSAAAPLLYDYVWSPGDLPLHAALYVPFALLAALEWRNMFQRPPLEFADDGSLRSRHAG